MKTYFTRAPFTKDKVARRELALAHTIIVLLSAALLAMLVANQKVSVRFDEHLVFFVCMLLLVVMIISAAIIAGLITTKKK